MDSCWACVEKWLSHIETGAEKRCKNRMRLFPQADKCRILNGFFHIKREKLRLIEQSPKQNSEPCSMSYLFKKEPS
jgi:hypothetical protein